jgi:hypothetical protein
MEPFQIEKLHPHSPLHPSLNVPGRQSLLQVPQTGPLEMPTSRSFSTYPSGAPARESSLQVPFTKLPKRKILHLQSPFQPHLKVPVK